MDSESGKTVGGDAARDFRRELLCKILAAQRGGEFARGVCRVCEAGGEEAGAKSAVLLTGRVLFG